MKKIDLEELIPGGEKYESSQPLMPTDIRFINDYYILIFSDGFGIYHRNNIQYHKYYKFDELDIIDNVNKNCRYAFLNEKTLFRNPQYISSTYEDSTIVLSLHDNKHRRLLKIIYNAKKSKIKSCELFKSEFNDTAIVNETGDIAYSSLNSIFVQLHDNTTKKLFSPGYTKCIELPSRNEFGIGKLLFWSPDNQKIAFYLVDDREVNTYPIVKLPKIKAITDVYVDSIKYPKAGEKGEEVTVGIVDINTKKCVFIDCKHDPDIPLAKRNICHDNSYLTSITWSPDSKYIYLCELERSQKYYQAKRYAAETGEFDEFLFDEESPTYVEPERPFHFINNDLFVFLSQRTGHNHIYSFNVKTKETKAITTGDWDVFRIFHIQNNTIIYSSNQVNEIGKNIFSIEIETLEQVLLTPEEGIHEYFHDDKSDLWVDIHSSHQTPWTTNFNGQKFSPYLRKTRKSFPYKSDIGAIQLNNDTIYYKAIYPQKIAEKKKLPIVFYVYGGPHVQLINDQWGTSTKGFEEMMAQEGYFVFMIDPHGSAHRGKAFEEKIYQNINQPQMADYDDALDWLLKESPYKEHLNPQKKAIYGWSFGGYMTLSMLLNSRHTFQIGVAGGAVVDWRLYEIMYTERYMGIRNIKDKETESIYEKFDIKQQIHRLKTPLYLIHCDNDPIVLWQHTLSLLDKINSIGNLCTLVDYYVFPGHGHNVRGRVRVALMAKVKGVIERYV